MRIRTSSGSRMRLGGRLFSGIPTEQGPLLGSVYRIANVGSVVPDNLNYFDINGQEVTSATLNPGESTFIIAQLNSLSDNGGTAGNSGQISITNLLLATSSLPTFTQFVSSSAGSFVFTKPEGVTYLIIECWGAGGAGGGATVNDTCGGGGGGGGYARSKIDYSSAQTNISFIVGTGGVSSTGDGNNGGSTTWDDGVIVAIGGYGGFAAAGVNTGGVGGLGGGQEGFFPNPNVGTVSYLGGGGANGSEDVVSGAGGGAAGSAADGAPASQGSALLGPSIAGIGGNEDGGDGANGGTTSGTNFTGLIGNATGGGGSGAQKVSGAGRSGGAGADGKISILYVV